ncbi:MAG: hypothetical protein LBI96_01870, partial [Odoribacteraceae bacterium]|nr:hypothetical protein [Odoribacteraceae bacterium]
MKKVILLMLALCAISRAFSQSIPFREISLDDAFLEAIIERKLVFVEVRAAWNGPSYYLNEAGVSGEDFKEFFDERFVCMQVDEGTTEGKEFVKRYHVDTYPAFLLLGINEEELYRIAGGVSADELVEKARRGAISTNALPVLRREYDSRKMSKVRMMDYFLSLQDGFAGDPACISVGKRLLASLSNGDKLSPVFWPLFSDLSVAPVPSEDFSYLLKHPGRFRASIGRERVDAYLLYCYETLLSPVFTREGDEVVDRSLLDALRTWLEGDDLPGREALLLEVEVARAYIDRDYERAFSLIEERVSLFSDAKLWMLANSFKAIRAESERQVEHLASVEERVAETATDPELKLFLRSRPDAYKRLFDTGVYWEDLPLEQALEQAGARGILVFAVCEGEMTGRTDSLFAREGMGDLLNKFFVNLKVDAAGEEGKLVEERYGVREFPTFLVLRPDGSLYFKMTGLMDGETFEGRVLAGLEQESRTLSQRYGEGERDPAFITAFIASLLEYSSESVAGVALEYVAGLPDSARFAAENWYVYEDALLSPPGGDLFDFLLERRAEFAAVVGEERVETTVRTRYMEACAGILAGRWVAEEEGAFRLFSAGFATAPDKELSAVMEIVHTFCA